MPVERDQGARAESPIVPGYVVGESIGSGGFGEVFAARHAVIGREVAIKILHAKVSVDETAVARFVSESRAVNQIAHPNIVQIHDFGTLADGRHYCVMERIRGETLRDVLRKRGRLSVVDAMPILRGIAEAVDAAHVAGIAHRDLKPDNIFVVDGGGVKLIDFGLAKLTRDDPSAIPVTRTGAVFGTPLYMSPEQCRGKALDLRTDCYSFGLVAYHVLCGSPPWGGDALELALHHLNDDPEPPSRRCRELDQRVDRVVLALLAKTPARRPTPLAAAIASMETASTRWRGRSVLAALTAVVIAGGVVFALASRSDDPATEARWTSRATPWPQRQIPMTTALAPEGDAVVFMLADQSVWRRRIGEEIATSLVLPDPATVRFVSPGMGGKLLVSRVEADGEWIWLEEIGGRRERLASGTHGRLGPDQRIAFLRGGEVYTRDLSTQKEVLVASVGGKIYNLAWSPDGQRLAWARGVPSNDSRAEVLDMRDGSIRRVSDVLLAITVDPLPLAFAGPSSIVYCDTQRRVRELDLETGAEITVDQLSREVAVCSVEASRDGSRLFVGTALAKLSTAVLPTRDPGRGWTRIADGGIEDFTPDNHVVVAAWPPPAPPRHRTRYMPRTRLLPSLASHAIGGGSTPLTPCPDATRFLRRGSELLYNVNVARGNALAMQLVRAHDCSVVDSWTIPDLPNWIFPVCGGELCATIRADDDNLVVWTLRRGESAGSELVRIASSASITRWVDLAVSPDDRWVAVTIPGGGDAIYLIEVAGGAVRTLHAGLLPGAKSTKDSAISVTWAADSRGVYVGGGDDASSAITLVTLAGQRTVVWSAASPNTARWARTSPDGKWLGANMLDFMIDVQTYDRSP